MSARLSNCDDPVANRLIVLPHIDPERGRTNMTVAAETRIADMVALAFPELPASALDRVRVMIGDCIISREVWRQVRPKPGTTVIIRMVPGNDTLRSVLSVAVLVSAIALGQFYAPTLAGLIFPNGITGLAGAGALTAAPIFGAIGTAGIPASGSMCLTFLASGDVSS
jgi:hypothetical protein